MNKAVLLCSFTALCLLINVFLMGFEISVEECPDVIHVPDDYEKIQWAVSNATAGDTILVSARTYYEHITIDKSLTLTGENRENTIIDGDGTGIIIDVQADNVSVNSFKIQRGFVGFSVVGGWHCAINEIIVKDCSTGISVFNSWYGYLNKNFITNNTVGIYLHSRGSVLRNNTIIENEYGMGFSQERVSLEDFVTNDIDISNTINGKPVYYLVNEHDLVISPSTFPEVGFLGLVNCVNVSVENLFLSDNDMGLLVAYTNNSRIRDLNIFNNRFGMYIVGSYNNTVTENNVTNNAGGIDLYYLDKHNIISKNYISHNIWGLYSGLHSTNTICENIFEDNGQGIEIGSVTSAGDVFHNVFINSEPYCLLSAALRWDNGYPSGGNYWSDYDGTDFYSGLNQNETGGDGIGDTAYTKGGSRDNYPLMGRFSVFKATSEYHLQTICNSTVSDFQLNATEISFNVTGENGTIGFCRISIPTALMNYTYKVFVNCTEVSHTLLPCSNNTRSYLYFTYNQSTQEVVIIPEFSSFLILPLFMLATLLAVIVYRRK